MMDDFARYERYRDDLMKWTSLPYWELPADLSTRKQPEGVFAELAPAAIKVIQARARVQQYLSLLQTIEAVRIHAAENEGKLPTSLAETKLPIPVDPVTGKPFIYEREGRGGGHSGHAARGSQERSLVQPRLRGDDQTVDPSGSESASALCRLLTRRPLLTRDFR